MRRRPALLLVLAPLLALMPGACDDDRGGTVDPADHDAFFLWAGVPPPPVLAKASEIYILDGEVRARGQPAFTPLRPQAPRIRHARVWLTVRLERLDWPEALHQRILGELARWEAEGNAVAGLTLDFDARTQGLSGYAAFLKEVRRRLPTRYRLSVTGLLDWSANADPAALATLGGVVDEVIIQTYQGRDSIPGYDRYFERIADIPLPFRIALVEGGAWRPPPALERSPHFRGYVVFLLPPRRSA